MPLDDLNKENKKIDLLKQYKELLDLNILTQEEYELVKDRILNNKKITKISNLDVTTEKADVIEETIIQDTSIRKNGNNEETGIEIDTIVEKKDSNYLVYNNEIEEEPISIEENEVIIPSSEKEIIEISEDKKEIEKNNTDEGIDYNTSIKNNGKKKRRKKLIQILIALLILLSAIAVTLIFVFKGIDSKNDDNNGTNNSQSSQNANTNNTQTSKNNSNTQNKEGKIYFGSYYINNSNTKETIEWDILEEKNGKALIISHSILDSKVFDYTSNNYKTSYIRNWLNDYFYNTAFNDTEKAKIITTLVDNSVASTGYSSNSYTCDDTNDKLFLLSYKELNAYFDSKDYRTADGTSYAVDNGLYVHPKYHSIWWLRSPINSQEDLAYCVSSTGGINTDRVVYHSNFGVRPACWITI